MGKGRSNKKRKNAAKANLESLKQSLRANNKRCRTMAKMSGSILVYLVYYVITLSVSFQMAEVIKDSPAEANYGASKFT